MRSRSRTEEPAAPWVGGSEGAGVEVEADETLLVAAARADPRAFAPLYHRYVSPVYRYCYLRLGDREAAEDATNEVFMKALAGLGGLRGGTFAAWLFRIAHNVVVDSYRCRRPSVPVESAVELADPAPGVEAIALARDEGTKLHAALERLPEEQRLILELDLAGWAGPQIAAALGKSQGAVRVLRYRALKRLRGIVSDPRSDHEHEHEERR